MDWSERWGDKRRVDRVKVEERERESYQRANHIMFPHCQTFSGAANMAVLLAFFCRSACACKATF